MLTMDPFELSGIEAKLHELLQEGEELARGYREIAEINQAFVDGDQWGSVIPGPSKTTITRDDWPDEEDLPRIAVNQIAGLTDVKVSLLTKQRPCAIARPQDDDIEDIWACESVNAVIKYLISELKTSEHVHSASRGACVGGSAGIKIWWDASKRLPKWAPVTVDQVTIDPWCSENIQDAQWIIFHRWFSPSEAEKLLRQAGHDDEPGTKEYKTLSGITRKGVQGFELWHKPCEEYPEGLFAFLVGDRVIEAKPFPYVIESNEGPEYLMPLVWIRDRRIPECIYGATSTTLCVPLQRRLNITAAQIARIADTHAHPTYVVPQAHEKTFDPMKTTVIGRAKDDNGKYEVLQPAPVSREMREELDFYRRSMLEVIGINEITAGSDSKARSGAAIERTAELDAQRNAAFSRSIETAVLDAYRITLALMQLFLDDGALLRITGQGPQGAMIFRRADIQGVTARLEIGSELDLLQPAEELIQAERRKAGLASEDEVKSAVNDPRYAFSRQFGEQAVQAVLDRQIVDINPEDADMGVVLKVVQKHKRLAMLEGRKADWLLLEQFDAFVRQLAAQAKQQEPREQAEQAQPGQPAAPPAPQQQQGAPSPGGML